MHSSAFASLLQAMSSFLRRRCRSRQVRVLSLMDISFRQSLKLPRHDTLKREGLLHARVPQHTGETARLIVPALETTLHLATKLWRLSSMTMLD